MAGRHRQLVAPPAAARTQTPNVEWRTTRCTSCGDFRAALTALTALAHDTGLRITRTEHTPYPPLTTPAPYLLTFDGSHAVRQDRHHSGAAAILWGPVGPHGRPQVATDTAANTCTNPLDAEAAGCSLGLQLLTRHGPPSTCLVVGDCPTVIGLGAGACRARRPALHYLLGHALGHALLQGWEIQWLRIPRRLNDAADLLARAAAGLPPRRRGRTTHGTDTEVAPGDPPAMPEGAPPATHFALLA